MSDFSQNWLLMALLTPVIWAIVCLLDGYLTGSQIYRKPSDGMLVSCLFCLAPAVLTFSPDLISSKTTILETGLPFAAIAAGLSFVVHLYFYFRTLQCFNDVSGAETFSSLSVLIVPLFAWLLLDELLPSQYYLAFALAAVGVLIQCLPVIKALGITMLINLVVSVLSVSLSMVLQASALQTHGFAASTFSFNLTCFLVAAIAVATRSKIRQRLIVLIRRAPLLLLIGEVLGVMSVLSSHRATQIAPSVSVVALVECLLPLIIILLSFLVLAANRFTPLISFNDKIMLELQIDGARSKILAFLLLIVSLSTLSI